MGFASVPPVECHWLNSRVPWRAMLVLSHLRLTLCDLTDCSPPGPSVHGILQARILEWVAIPFSKGHSWLRDRIQVSCTAGRLLTIWATREATGGLWTPPHLVQLNYLLLARWWANSQTEAHRKWKVFVKNLAKWKAKAGLKCGPHAVRELWGEERVGDSHPGLWAWERVVPTLSFSENVLATNEAGEPR